MKKVFIDSSVFLSAVNSPTGGSAKLFTLVNQIELHTSRVVLTEVERNVRKKLYSHHLQRFFKLARKVNIVDQEPDEQLIKRAKKAIVEKDAVILAEAKQAKTDYLVTLDKKHFLTSKTRDFLKPQYPVTPKILIQET
jgi:putative PIN family toxin of toxin-antitoxin system